LKPVIKLQIDDANYSAESVAWVAQITDLAVNRAQRWSVMTWRVTH